MHMPIQAAPSRLVWRDIVGSVFDQYRAEHGTVVAEARRGEFRATVEVDLLHPSELPSGLNFRWRVYFNGVIQDYGWNSLPVACCAIAERAVERLSAMAPEEMLVQPF